MHSKPIALSRRLPHSPLHAALHSFPTGQAQVSPLGTYGAFSMDEELLRDIDRKSI